ncbi:MAG: tetratricopeptide repeat protein [Candidatus Omnitrophica bacterium]|nr:tetratricopeptide repeat protein [Candidatus Omnitrophota bacterium]
MNYCLKKFLLLLCLSFLTLEVFGETILLKNGRVIEGRITLKTADFIKVDYFNVPLTLYFDDIETIDSQPVETIAAVDKLSDHDQNPSVTTKELEATELVIKGYFEQAESILRDELKDNPESISLSEAIKLLEDRRKNLVHAEAIKYIFSARFYFYNNNYTQALSQYHQAIIEEPDYYKSYSFIANLYLFLSDNEKALYYFEKSLEKNPNQPEVNVWLGHLNQKVNNYNRARKFYRAAKEQFLKEGNQSDISIIDKFISRLPVQRF